MGNIYIENFFLIFFFLCVCAHELRQTLGDSEGQGGLGCCSPWGCKKLDTT